MRELLDRVTAAHNALARAYALDGALDEAAMEMVLCESYGEPDLEDSRVIGHVPEPLAGRDYTALRDEVAEAHAALAAHYLERQNWARTVEEARVAIDYNAGLRAAWQSAGRAHAALGREAGELGDPDTCRVHWRGATAAWQHALDLGEQPDPDSLLALAEAEAEAGNLMGALETYRHVLALRPEDAAAIEGIGLIMADVDPLIVLARRNGLLP